MWLVRFMRFGLQFSCWLIFGTVYWFLLQWMGWEDWYSFIMLGFAAKMVSVWIESLFDDSLSELERSVK